MSKQKEALLAEFERREAVKRAERAVIEAADQWEADQGDTVDCEIELAKRVREWREAV